MKIAAIKTKEMNRELVKVEEKAEVMTVEQAKLMEQYSNKYTIGYTIALKLVCINFKQLQSAPLFYSYTLSTLFLSCPAVVRLFSSSR